jgi:hypothetical protein
MPSPEHRWGLYFSTTKLIRYTPVLLFNFNFTTFLCTVSINLFQICIPQLFFSRSSASVFHHRKFHYKIFPTQNSFRRFLPMARFYPQMRVAGHEPRAEPLGARTSLKPTSAPHGPNTRPHAALNWHGEQKANMLKSGHGTPPRS